MLNKNGNSAVPTIIEALKNAQEEQLTNFTVISPEKIVSHKNLNMLNRQNVNSVIAIGYSFTNETKKTYNVLQSGNTATVFEGTIYTSSSKTKEEGTGQETTKKLPQNAAQLQVFIEKIDGDYSVFILKNEEITVTRDPIGTQPLYYGENKEVAVFASNRKTLVQLGITETLSFPPGNLGSLTKSGVYFNPVKTFSYVEPIQISMDDAAGKLQKLLEQSIEARIAGFKDVAVAFSGGLDSSLIAYIASKFGVKVNLIHVSLENEKETETAFEASEKLDLSMQVHLFKDLDVEKALPKIVDLIEDANPVKAAIGIPVYWSAQKAREADHTVLLAGQGADELFGGYQRYVNEYYCYGSKKVQQTMFNDVIKIHENNLERDKKICRSLDVELRLPFISSDLIEFALSLPVELKIGQNQNTLRKIVLRKVALNMGLPTSIVNKPKKAVQYSTGINNAIKRIAQKNCQTVNDYIKDLYKGNIKKT